MGDQASSEGSTREIDLGPDVAAKSYFGVLVLTPDEEGHLFYTRAGDGFLRLRLVGPDSSEIEAAVDGAVSRRNSLVDNEGLQE